MTGDTCPTCGQPVPGAPKDDCRCGHGRREHHVTKTARTTYCYRLSCGCETYRPREAPRG